MKTKFLQISLGISLMLFAGGFFIRSVTTANAAPVKLRNIAQGSNDMGNYQFAMYTLVGGIGILRGNTMTGDMEMFFYDKNTFSKISH